MTHIIGVRPHTCRFGDGYRPECTDCHYVGPVAPWPRANAIAIEHRRKSSDAWRPAW